MADGSPRQARRFSAFISYSNEDAAFARRLHRRLETYRLPRRLTPTRPDAPATGRLRPLFRDEDELSASHDLSAALRDALAQSEFLIVVCSPSAARSDWVGREIEYFRSLHGDRRILTALAAGAPEDAFHPALRRNTGGAGIEPLAADFRRESGLRHLAMLKLVAALAEVELDQLIQRDAQRTTRRAALSAAAAGVVLAVMAGLTWVALDSRAEAARKGEQATGLVDYMVSDVRKDLQRVGRLDQLAELNDKAMSYYAGQDLSRLSDDELRQRAKILQAMGEDDEKRGDLARARTSIEEARRTTAALLAARPQDPERIFAHAQSEYWVGFIHWRAGDGRAARQGFENYASLARRLVAMEPGKAEWRMEVGYAENNLGMLAMRQRGDLAAAQRHFMVSLGVKRALAEAKPDDVERQRDLANGYAWLADAQRLQGDFRSATDNRATQKAILQALLKKDPDNVEIHSDLLGNDLAVARIEAAEGRQDRANRRLDKARVRALDLVALDPDNKSIRRQARAVQLFKTKFLLDSRSGARPAVMARALRDCAEADNAGDRELVVFCNILLDRARGVKRPLADILPADFPRDLYTSRWGINLSEEHRLE